MNLSLHKKVAVCKYTMKKILRDHKIFVICIGDFILIDNELHIFCKGLSIIDIDSEGDGGGFLKIPFTTLFNKLSQQGVLRVCRN